MREWGRVLKPGGRLVMSTWAPGDPRWGWERDIRRKYASGLESSRVEQMVEGLQRIAGFDAVGKVDAELRAAGFEPDAIEPHAIDFFFADEQAWLDWNMSHAGREYISALSPDARERFRDEAFEAMQPLRTERGFPRTYTALFAQATVAPDAANA